MDRFVAMLWDRRVETRTRQACAWSEALQRTSAHWKIVLDSPGLRALALAQRKDEPVVAHMEGAEGVVIGPLFERGHERSGRLSRLNSTNVSSIIASHGDDLVKAFWGNYVALWREARTDNAHVLRDPCGAISCFRTRAEGIDLLCSYVADIADLPALRFAIDWDYVRAFLLNNYFITKHTGLKDISELLPGERMTWRPDREPEFSWAWSAASLAAQPRRQNFENAQAELRDTAEACFTAWGKTYNDIVVRISGGLDSSIVANLLRRVSDARITGLHLAGRGYEAYELRLARLASQHAGIDLLELDLDPNTADLRSIANGPKLARPTKQVLGDGADQLVTGACGQLGADSVMAGHGGDSLFLQRSIAVHVLADYVRLNGVGKDFWRIAYEAATLLERPIWRVVSDAFAFGLGFKKWRADTLPDEAKQNPDQLLTPGAANAIPVAYTSHPTPAGALRLPPCKADQLHGILALSNYNVVGSSGVERDALNPFVSQPIVEFALTTPTYLFTHGGFDRALERGAFADLIPDAIARRTGKGFINHYLITVLSRNITFLRELVLDGELVGQDWIDRVQAERLLSPEHLLRGRSLEPACNLIVAEAWLCAWRRHDTRDASVV